ncbi:NAD(P)-binding domain-containing protein [Hyphomicrobium sp.]|jgi:3-hydroxyisobutyrate dehydrogenase|uniref:NAD(P)-binding domain-containing protein n=1 Tax=Hyphomicrobium sp. TaxID=82 RepID=UPI002B8481E6|nr:NAD(P)-binding domain-containing protein [Hyphomicrobium sp.]HVZ04627.1 NAD(P)-binding domain-containing protein [Hyphomicrobium sp.]
MGNPDLSYLKPVGVIGNDDYGPAIARRIAACGYRTLYTGLSGSPVVARGERIEPAPTPTDIAAECAIALVAIDDTETLRELLVGNNDRMGFGAEMEPGSVVVDLGARTPRELQALLGLLGTRGVAVVDGALIGGVDAAGEGRAKIFVGGYPDAVDVAEKVLALLGSVERTGPLGSAHAVAALMGYVEAAHAVAREEAIALGNACGLTPAVLTRMLSDTSLLREPNVTWLSQRAELARRIAHDRGLSADIIDLASEKRARQKSENR